MSTPDRPERGPAPTLFHITHWKAGSQWIQKILRDLAAERIVAPRTGEGQFLFDPLVPGGVYPTVYVTKEQFDGVVRPADARHFVVLRDLRDTVVSAYFSFRYSHGLIASGLADLRSQLEARDLESGMLYLIEKWLPGAASIHASWLAAGADVLWYEDLLHDDVALLERALLHEGGMQVDPARLRAVVEANRFAALTKGRAPGNEDTRAHERKGVAGDWKTHFTPRIARRFDELYGELIDLAASRGAGRGAAAAPVRPRTTGLGREEILSSFDAVSARHPNMPTYSLWLACEHAALRRFGISGRVLDLGCSDPGFFRLCCAAVDEAIGVAANPTYAEWAQQSGLYAQVRRTDALDRFDDLSDLDHVFTRTTLSQTTRLDPLLAQARRSLRPGGTLVCTVLTDRYRDWAGLARVLELAGQPRAAARVLTDHLATHGIVHALPAATWEARFGAAGFEIADSVTILPRVLSHLFLLFDMLWHRPAEGGGKVGDDLTAWLSARPQLRQGLRGLLAALLDLEPQGEEGAAVVYALRKPAA